MITEGRVAEGRVRESREREGRVREGRERGAVSVSVQAAAFDSSRELAALRETLAPGSVGALASFVGTVRDRVGRERAEQLESLTLVHYPAMTHKEITAIAERARAQFAVEAIRVVHRHGVLRVGDEIVLVAVAAAHRAAAFDACRYVMDFLKTDAPFWKRETLVSGASRWVEARDSDVLARAGWRQRE